MNGLKKFFILLFVLVIAFLGYKFILKKSNVDDPVISSTIEKYNYTLLSNKSTLYKNLFKELSDVLNNENIDEEKYVTIISKLFIIDFYTLDDKNSNLDIGGIQFVHKDVVDNFKLKAKETIYKYVKSNIYGDRNQKLPIVKEITSCDVTKKSLDSKPFIDKNAYYVDIVWNYKKDYGYETSKTLIFVHEDNKLSLISIN